MSRLLILIAAVNLFLLAERSAVVERKNDFIRAHGFQEYSKWHLGIDKRHKPGSKARYKFPFGDFTNVHRCGLLAVKARARQYGYADIEAAAEQLLAELEITRPRR